MNSSLNTLRILSALTMAAALTACGGGGASAPATPVPPPPAGNTDVVDVAGTLQTSATAPTYAANSTALSAYNALSVARTSAGAGVVAQSAQLDTAAGAHAAYLTANIASGLTHTEDSTKPSYYEATVGSRIAKAGFNAGFATEVIGGAGASMQGSDCVLGLLNTVYHAAALLSPATQVGVGFGTDGAGVPLCVADLAATSAQTYGQVPAAGALVAYPYNTQANVLDTFYVGYESPRPSATLFPNLTAGTPVVVSVRNADYLNFKAAGTLAVVVTKFELKDAGGNVVPSGILANSAITGSGVTLTSDSNLGEGFAVLVPLSPLSNNVTYTATFTATLKSGATPLTKTWSFTTNP